MNAFSWLCASSTSPASRYAIAWSRMPTYELAELPRRPIVPTRLINPRNAARAEYEQSIRGNESPFVGSVTLNGLVSSRVSIAAGVSASPESMSSAAHPVACGEAALVPPEGVNVPPERKSEVIDTPGAKMSVVALLFENAATTSRSSDAPTDTTLLRQAGAGIIVPEPLLPAAANAMTPIERRVLMAAAPAIVNAAALSHAPAKRSVVPKLMLIARTWSVALFVMR